MKMNRGAFKDNSYILIWSSWNHKQSITRGSHESVALIHKLLFSVNNIHRRRRIMKKYEHTSPTHILPPGFDACLMRSEVAWVVIILANVTREGASEQSDLWLWKLMCDENKAICENIRIWQMRVTYTDITLYNNRH